MLDANSNLDDKSFSTMLTKCQLHDIHRNSPAPSTYIGAQHRRIDYIFGSLPVANAARQQGSLSYYEGPLSDHRGLFVDLHIPTLLGSFDISQSIPPIATRLLKSGNPELVERNVERVHTYYNAHDMVARIDRLNDTHSTMSRSEVRKRLEQWDTDQGKAMKAAEASLKRQPQRIPWSPNLRNDFLLRRYWKLRLQDALNQSDYSVRMLRLQSQIQQGDPTFVFPFWKANLSLDDICHHLNQSSRALRLIQRDASSLRHHTLYNLLATYNANTNPQSTAESQRKAKIVQQTIDREHQQQMFSHIRSQVRPNEASGLTSINVPVSPTQPHLSPSEVLATTLPVDIVWEKIIDRQAIEAQIIKFNQSSFRAAADSPCGHGVIHDELKFTSLSPTAVHLLEGEVPDDWKENDAQLQAFFSSFAIPDHVEANPPHRHQSLRRGCIMGYLSME